MAYSDLQDKLTSQNSQIFIILIRVLQRDYSLLAPIIEEMKLLQFLISKYHLFGRVLFPLSGCDECTVEYKVTILRKTAQTFLNY